MYIHIYVCVYVYMYVYVCIYIYIYIYIWHPVCFGKNAIYEDFVLINAVNGKDYMESITDE